ncbi:hypothetical protein M2138_000101 [Dysgonomonadaceae bacterium PH5-43]|nr:hypothetical protein [Dysgonomonadaceae bacterium PH5-43]
MSIDFIPIQLYTPIYYNVMLLVILFVFVHTQIMSITNEKIILSMKSVGFLSFCFVLIYLGLRPISIVFVDMVTYDEIFMSFQYGREISPDDNDLVFKIFTLGCSKIMSAQFYFFVCAILYVVPMYIISKKWFDKYWFYAFLMLVVSFSFWAYGTNGIRNGIATSLFLLAISRDKRIWQIVWLVIAIGFHKTLLLPSLGFIITWFYNKPKGFFLFWLSSIILSLMFSGFWEGFFAGMIEDDRARYLTTKAETDSFASVGFRWDFLIYSATGVFAGWYYIFKKKLKDQLYISLFNVYLFANAFWILVIKANFSNRFAYLSWFLLALVIIYPWLKYNFQPKQTKIMGWIIFAYFGFTYFMNFIYYGR